MLKKSELIPRILQQNGLWGYIIELGEDGQGKRKQKKSFKKSYKTKTEAKRAALDFIENYSDEVIYEIGTITLKECFDLWMHHYQKNPDIKTITITQRKSIMKQIQSDYGDYLLNKMTVKEWQEILNNLMEHYSKNSFSMYLLVIRCMLKELERIKILPFGYTSKLFSVLITKKREETELKKDNIREKFLERWELETILNQIEKGCPYVYYALSFFLAHTGLRIGEALALQWEDIDFNGKTVDIFKTTYRSGGKDIITTPKTKSSRRKIIIPQPVLNVLQQWRNMQNMEKQNPNYKHDYNFIFTSPSTLGKNIESVTYRGVLNRALKKTDVKKHVTPHVFRHTHISMLAQAGVPLNVISARVGHSSSKTTTSIYMHVTKEAEKQNILVYEKMFGFRDENTSPRVIRVAK